jgi:hypothetical protein
MEITLETLVDRWRGRHATLDIDLVQADGAGVSQSFHYEGILDGPYVDDGPGIGFMLGSRSISGEVAVGGPFVSFEPARPEGPSASVLAENYVELRVVELPLVAQVEAGDALWEALLADGQAARCRLCTAGKQ